MGEDADRGLKVGARDVPQEFVTELMGGAEDFIQNGFRATLKMDNLATPIVRRFPPFDPAVSLEPVEQPDQGRLLNAHALSQFFLRKAVPAIRKVDQRPPFSLAQAKGAGDAGLAWFARRAQC